MPRPNPFAKRAAVQSKQDQKMGKKPVSEAYAYDWRQRQGGRPAGLKKSK